MMIMIMIISDIVSLFASASIYCCLTAVASCPEASIYIETFPITTAPVLKAIKIPFPPTNPPIHPSQLTT